MTTVLFAAALVLAALAFALPWPWSGAAVVLAAVLMAGAVISPVAGDEGQ